MENESSSLGKKAVRSTIYTLIGDYFVYIINFVRGIVLARILMPEVYGIFKLAEFFKGIFGQPKNVGFDQALINQKEDLEKAYNGHFVLNITAAVISAILAFAASPILFKYYDSRVIYVLWALVGTLLLQAAYSTPSTYLRKNFAFRRFSLINAVGAVISFGISVYLALQGYGVWALVSVVVSMEVTRLILFWLLTGWRPSFKVDWQLNKKMLFFGGTIWVGGLFSFLMLQFDDFLVGQFAGLTVLGFYSKAYTLAQQPLGLFSQVINKVAGPAITEVRDQPEKLERGFNLVMSLVFKGTIFIGMVLFIWAPEIIDLLIGGKWLPMVPMFRSLIFYLIAQPVWDIVGSFLVFTGKPKTIAVGQAIQAGLLLTVGTLVVYRWHGVGAALTVSVILLSTTLFFIYRFIGRTLIVEWWHVFVLPTLVVLVSGVFSLWVINLMSLEGVMFWTSVCLVPSLTYAGLLFVFQGKMLLRDARFLLSVVRKK